jgi:hypothetical protein
VLGPEADHEVLADPTDLAAALHFGGHRIVPGSPASSTSTSSRSQTEEIPQTFGGFGRIPSRGRLNRIGQATRLAKST